MTISDQRVQNTRGKSCLYIFKNEQQIENKKTQQRMKSENNRIDFQNQTQNKLKTGLTIIWYTMSSL